MIILLAVTSVLVALCHAQTCDDVDPTICQDMFAVNPDICSSTCYSVALCPRFCGKCPLKCYSCHEVDRPELCNTTVQCPSADHFCIQTQGFNDDFKDVYKLGCALTSVCTAHFGPAFGRRGDSLSKRSGPQGSCCSTDLCNLKPPTTTTSSPPSTQQPTMMPTTASFTAGPPSTQKPTIMPTTASITADLPQTQQPTMMPTTERITAGPPSTKQPAMMPTTERITAGPPSTKQPAMMPTTERLTAGPPSTQQPVMMPTTERITAGPLSTKQPAMMPTTEIQSPVSIFPDLPRDLSDILSPARRNQTLTSVSAVTSSLCDDIDADICSRLETHFPDMCNIDCIANEVCPRKCGKCMGCYQCNHVTSPETCTQKTICGIGERCFSVETISANFEQGFKLGCMDERLCETFVHAAPNIFGKRQGFELSLHGGCCKGEFCNQHGILPTSTAPTTTTTTMAPTTTVPTTTMPTTTTKGCPTHHSTCPHGWLHHHTSCYAIGTPASTWISAKAQCEKQCGDLADFDSSTDLHSVALDLSKHFSGFTNADGVHVWVAGQLVHSVWQWTTTGHQASSSLQHNNHFHYTYCGYITVAPISSHTSSSSHLNPQACSVPYLPLCEIKHVN